MISLEETLTPERCFVSVPGGSKKRILEKIAQLIVKEKPHFVQNKVFESLVAREKLGSTGLGNGVAIPHCRLNNCDSSFSLLLRLEEAIDFDAIDAMPINLLFVLIVPLSATDEHLALLKQVAGLLDDKDTRESLQQAGDANALYEIATNSINYNL
ncbi:UNVERIFIED_CONTAM: hypothetical protein GTU68_056397 [Idotea baltica]|nr:hypothetical protein [Idotea baltica]